MGEQLNSLYNDQSNPPTPETEKKKTYQASIKIQDLFSAENTSFMISSLTHPSPSLSPRHNKK